MAVRAVDHVVIAVSHWERSNRFYGDVLGAEVVEISPGRWAYQWGCQRLNVHGPDTEAEPVARIPVTPGNSDLCLAWDGSIAEAIEHLARHDIAVELGPVERIGVGGQGVSVYLRDPDGSLVELITYH